MAEIKDPEMIKPLQTSRQKVVKRLRLPVISLERISQTV